MSIARARRAGVNIWPGFVDGLATLLIVIIFLLMMFTVAQFLLSQALSGRDKALEALRSQVAELAQLLSLEQRTTEELRQSIASLSGELESSIAERDALTEELSAANARITGLEGLLSELRGDLERTVADLDRTAADLDSARAIIAERDQEIASLEAEAERQRAALDDSRSETAAARDEAAELQRLSDEATEQVMLLNQQLAALRRQIAALNEALEAAEAENQQKDVQIADLGKRLNVALASKVQELARYRSEFFGKLREALGDRPDIRVVGDRFVFQAEVLFPSGSAQLQPAGQVQLRALAETLEEIAATIPSDLNWILRVDGHTDLVPIKTAQYPSNWELSAARAISVVKFLISEGIPANRLVAAGFGEFHPLDPRDDEIAYRRNRRIEMKLDQR